MTGKRHMIGIDIGGTFTDIVAVDEKGIICTTKVPSTPSNPEIGVLDGVKKVAITVGTSLDEFVSNIAKFVYGTTVATNILLQRKGLDIALIMTRGFRDQLSIRRMWRENAFDLRSLPPTPFLPLCRTYEITERIDYRGNIITPLVEDEVKPIAEEIKKAGINSVAICFLFSFVNPIHEKRAKDLLLRELPDLKVSISSNICSEIREYERASTVAVNAYLAGTVEKHLENLENELSKIGLNTRLQIMQSSGGVSTASFIADRPVNIFLSGPSGGGSCYVLS